MAFSAKAVANRFLDLANAADEPISQMKMQKLVYISHGWLLGLRDEDLIDDRIEAWKFGPVIPALYHEFKKYGNQPISEPAKSIEWVRGQKFAITEPRIDEYPENAEKALALTNRIWDIYGGLSAVQLSNLTHEEGTPWHQIYKQYNGNIPSNTVIPREIIRDYYAALASS